MTLKPTDYALLAQDVYTDRHASDQVTLDGVHYDVIAVSDARFLGFQGTAYRRTDSFEVVIAYRGTEFDREPVKDGVVDAGMVVAGLNLQERQAEAFTREAIDLARRDALDFHKPLNVTVTGHSLGGSLAEINAHRFGLSGQTFNAYGATGLSGGVPAGGHSVINHVRAGDPVSAASLHFGEVRTYATETDVTTLKHAGYDSQSLLNNLRTVRAVDFSAHSIDNFVPHSQTLGRSIIDPENEARYRANHVMIDRYRNDVFEIRGHASTVWETRNAVLDAVDRGAHAAGRTAMGTGRAVSESVGAGANTAADQGRRFVGEKTHEFNDGLDVIGDAAGRAGRSMGEGAIAGLTATPVAQMLNGSQYGSAELDRMIIPTRLDRPEHPDHALFQQARDAVQRLDAQQGRTSDTLSENLAGALVVEARREGLNRIDRVVLSDDASMAYAMQGEPNSPFKRVAEVQTELGIATSIDQSSAAMRGIDSQQASQPSADVSQSLPTPTPTQAGPAQSM